MPLELIDILNGTFGLVAIAVSVYFAINIGSRYFKLKRIEFLLMGLVAIFLTEPWWPHSVAFIYALATGSDKGLIPEVYFIIGNIFIPAGIFFWLWIFSELIYKDKQKQLLLFGLVYAVIFEIAFFTMLLIDPILIGELRGPIHVKYNYGLIALLLSGVMIVSITSIIFCQQSLKSSTPDIRIRGKFILIGILTLLSGAIVEGFLSEIFAFLILSRSLIILSGLLFYIAFIKPEWVRKRVKAE